MYISSAYLLTTVAFFNHIDLGDLRVFFCYKYQELSLVLSVKEEHPNVLQVAPDLPVEASFDQSQGVGRHPRHVQGARVGPWEPTAPLHWSFSIPGF